MPIRHEFTQSICSSEAKALAHEAQVNCICRTLSEFNQIIRLFSAMKTIQPQTISDLEFDLVLDQVSQRALTQGGKLRLAIKPMIRATDIKRSLKEVEEYMASIGSDQSFPGHHRC